MRYEILGDSMPVVVCYLDNGESMITEKGSMVWMNGSMKMQTAAGGVGKALGRMFTGESLFQNIYSAQGGPGMIAFASSFPGSIRAVEVTPDKPVICQKSAFLASTEGIEMSVFFQKKIASGLFGGEGFLMQRLTGSGLVFLEIDGSAVEYDLGAGEQMTIDTGNLAMVSDSCSIDIQTVKGVKNVLFGGEGLFNTVVTGPGHIVLQTMPFSNFVSTIASAMPSKN